MRKQIIAGNWKMNGSISQVKSLVQGILESLPNKLPVGYEVVAIPSFIHIPLVAELIEKTVIRVGAQDISTEVMGAFTGQVSGKMLKEYGCQYVLCGHSERRAYCNESNQDVAKKCQAALEMNLTPIVCVGETWDQRSAGKANEIIKSQLEVVIELVGIQKFEQVVVAYEPVWAIGTGKTATPDIAQSVHSYCREILAGYNGEIAQLVPILYGGSLKPENATNLLEMPDIDGGLIGGASLDALSFSKIFEKAVNAENCS